MTRRTTHIHDHLYLHLRHSTRTLLRRCRRIRLLGPPRGKPSRLRFPPAPITWSLTKNAPRRARPAHAYFSGKLQKFSLASLPAAPPSRTASGPALEDSFGSTRSLRQHCDCSQELAPRRRRRSRIEPLLPRHPCHRIIGSDGSLTGFAFGLDAKIWLLKHEGIPCGETSEKTIVLKGNLYSRESPALCGRKGDGPACNERRLFARDRRTSGVATGRGKRGASD